MENNAADKKMLEELAQQVRVKSMQLSDLEVMIEDYQHERAQLLHEIGNLKALLWEMVGDPQEWATLGLDALDILGSNHSVSLREPVLSRAKEAASALKQSPPTP